MVRGDANHLLFEVGLCCGYKPPKLIDTGDLPTEEHWHQWWGSCSH